MSFFSNLKEKATAGLKAAEKYISVEDRKAMGAQNVERKPAAGDPLQAMVQKAVVEEAKKKEKEQDLVENTPESELHKLKAFIRAKLNEHEQVIEEYKGREQEYQKLLQENELEKQKSVKIINQVNQRYSLLEQKFNQTAKNLADVQTNATGAKPPAAPAEPELNIDLIMKFLSKKNEKSAQLQSQLASVFVPKEDPNRKNEMKTLATQLEEFKVKYENSQKYLKQFNEENQRLNDENDQFSKQKAELEAKLESVNKESSTKISEYEGKLKTESVKLEQAESKVNYL